MYKNRSKGFTLIELLVVIAIIGILSAVVLASLNTARSKGNDAAIKSNLDTVRTQAAIYYDTNNAYSLLTGVTYPAITAAGPTVGVCTTASSIFSDPNVAAAIIAGDKATVGGPGKVTCSIGASVAAGPGSATWAAYAPTANKCDGTNSGWCVDSTGVSKCSAVLAGAACP